MAQNGPPTTHKAAEPWRQGLAWAAVEAARRRAGLALPDGVTAAADHLGRLGAQWIAAELAPGRLMPWLPVAFGLGIAIYFTAEREPAWWAAAGLAAVGVALSVCARRSAVGFPLALGFAAIAAGFAVADPADRAHRASGAAPIRPGTRRSQALSRPARSARAPTASSCASHTHRRRRACDAQAASACASRCARARRRAVGSFVTFKAQSDRRRCSRCAPAATISPATCISRASAPPASCSARSHAEPPPHAPALRLRYRRAVSTPCATHQPAHPRHRCPATAAPSPRR